METPSRNTRFGPSPFLDLQRFLSHEACRALREPRPLCGLRRCQSACGRRAHRDEVCDESEVLLVPRQQRDVVNIRSSGDHEIERAFTRLTAATDNCCGKPSPFARDRSVDRQRIEGGFDDAETLRAPGSLVLRTCHQDAEVQFRERRGTYRTLEPAGTFRADQNGRGEDGPHYLAKRSATSAGNRSRSSSSVSGAGVFQTR